MVGAVLLSSRHPPGGFPAHLHRLHADLTALQSPAAPISFCGWTGGVPSVHPLAGDQRVQLGPCHPSGTPGLGCGNPKPPRHIPVPIPSWWVRGSPRCPARSPCPAPPPPAPRQSKPVPLTGPSFRAEPLEGSEQEKATYSLHKRRKILRLVSQWVLLYGRLLQGDRSTTALLQVPGAGGASPGGVRPPPRGADPPLSSPRTSPTWRAGTPVWEGWCRSRNAGGPECELGGSWRAAGPPVSPRCPCPHGGPQGGGVSPAPGVLTPLSVQVGERRRQRFSPAQGKGGGGSGGAGTPPGEGWLWGRHRARSLPPRAQARSSVSWLASQEEAALSSSCALRAQDKGRGAPGGGHPLSSGHPAEE